jgi:hypothetical protein
MRVVRTIVAVIFAATIAVTGCTHTNTDQPRAGTREDLLRALDARSLADQIHQQGRQVATEFIQGRHLLQEDAQRPPPGP